jgi:hypothetical protein
MQDICKVMMDKGITDTQSYEAIQVCLNCPLPLCSLSADCQIAIPSSASSKAHGLHESGYGIAEISKIMHRSKRQVIRYLEVVNA